MEKPRILIVDDEEGARESLRMVLKPHYDACVAADGASALAVLQSGPPVALVLLDMRLPDIHGLDLLGRVQRLSPGTPVVVVTAVNETKPAVEAMKIGAVDYLTKPFDATEILRVVERELGQSAAPEFENIIGNSPAMRKVYALMRQLLPTDSTVLITGETGTGKELVARALHNYGPRKAGPFVPMHCATVPSELLESELFGHERGSFTGAMQRRIGVFESANGGTLFLDEIGEMPLVTQTKLLRAIQEREIRRVGGQDTIRIDVRLICATNRNLADEVRTGRFREDLFYRINVVPVALPPLRERTEDIPQLVMHFAQRVAKELDRPVPEFTAEAMEVAKRYPWPGNARELEHIIERLLVTAYAPRIGAEQLALGPLQPRPRPAAVSECTVNAYSNHGVPYMPQIGPEVGEMDLTLWTETVERKAITEALRRTGGVITEAARLLKVTRRILRYKMDKLGIAVTSQETVPPAGAQAIQQPPAQS